MRGAYRRGGRLAVLMVLAVAVAAGVPVSAARTTPTPVFVAAASDAVPPAWCYQPEYDPAAPAPPPYICDRDGSDQDEVFVPASESYSYVHANGVGFSDGPNSTRGRGSVFVRADYFDEHGYYIEGPIYTLTFDSARTGTEAKDSYRVELGRCIRDVGRVAARFWYTNRPDATHRYKSSVDLTTVRRPDELGPNDILQVNDVLDGETRLMGTLYLVPGTHKVDVTLNDRVSSFLTPDVVVPRCGDEVPPGTGGGHHARPTGTLSKQRGSRVRAVGVNRGVGTWTRFQVLGDPRVGSTRVVESFAVAPGRSRTRTTSRKPGTTYVLRARGKSTGWTWRALARLTT